MQFNNLSLADTYGRGQRELQQQEYNALRMEGMEKQMGDAERLDNAKWMQTIAQQGIEQVQNNPNSMAEFMREVEKEGQRRGVWENIGGGKFDYTTASPEVILQGFQAMGEQASIGLAGQPQDDPSLVKDAEGYNRFAGGDKFGERAFPDAQRPAPGAGSITGPLQEIDRINLYRGGEFEETDIDPEKYLANRVRRSADMQAYNQYLIDAKKSGQEPMSEQEYAQTRAGGIAGAKTTGTGMATRQLDIPRATALRSQTTQNFTRLTDAVSALADNDQMWKAVGLSKSIAAIPGTEGANIRADIQNIKSQVGFMVLQDMRNASKTGGALGQVSEKENELLQDNLASLDVNQSPEHFRKNLRIILDYLRQAQARLDNSWALTYPELDEFGRSTEQTQQPAGDDFQVQWDAAKSGDVLTAPDGTQRRKP